MNLFTPQISIYLLLTNRFRNKLNFNDSFNHNAKNSSSAIGRSLLDIVFSHLLLS